MGWQNPPNPKKLLTYVFWAESEDWRRRHRHISISCLFAQLSDLCNLLA
jgi:hypothetical protein